MAVLGRIRPSGKIARFAGSTCPPIARIVSLYRSPPNALPVTLTSSLRAQRSNPSFSICCIMDCFVAPLLAMTTAGSHPALQRVADFVEHLGILDGGGHRPWIAVGDLLDGAAQDFSRARLRQPRHRDRELERRH